MKKILIALFLNNLLHLLDGKSYELGPFDRLFVDNDTFFFLSARPCAFDDEVVLTVMRVKGEPFFLHYNRTNEILQPIPIYKNKSIGFILNLHSHLDSSVHEIHATIKEVNLTVDGKAAGYLPNNFLDVIWKFDPKICQEFISQDNATTNPGFMKQRECTYSKRQGDFSTLCFKKYEGIYIIVMNICDVPYSVKVVWINSGSAVTTRTYTAEKDDNVIHINDSRTLGGGSCGLILSDFHGHRMDHKKQHVVLKYVCTNPHEGRNMTLIDDSYFTVYGQICETSNCQKINSSLATRRICEVMVRDVTGALVKSTIQFNLNVCEKVVNGDVEISIDGFPNSFKASMKALKVYQSDATAFVYFNMTRKPGVFPHYKHTGFLPLTTGQLTLRVTEIKSQKLFQVMLFRHFPSYHDSLPLVRDAFYINRKYICKNSNSFKKEGGGLNAWTIIIVLVCIIAGILGALLLYKCWRNRSRYKRGFGLPYHMELDEDEFSIDTHDMST